MAEKKEDIRVHDCDKVYIGNLSLNTLIVLDALNNQIIKKYDVSIGTKDIFVDGIGNVYAVSSLDGTITIIRRDENIDILSIENDGYAAVDHIINRIYVTNGGCLNIYDLSSCDKIASIDGLDSPSYIKIDIQDNKLYIVDRNSIKTFDTITLEYTGEIYAPDNINNICFGNDKKIYISYGNAPLSCGIEIYDIFRKGIINTIKGNEFINPGAMAVINNMLYVANNISKGNIRVIDLPNRKILPDIVNVGANPSYMLAFFKKKKIYITNSGSGTVSILDVVNKRVESILIGAAAQPCCIASNNLYEDMNIGRTSEKFSNFIEGDMKSYMYIIAKKVFSSYQQRICFPIVNIPIPEDSENINFEKILFENGNIVEDSLIISPIEDREDYSRVQMSIDIPYRTVFSTEQGNVLNIKGTLPQIYKDIVVMIPHSRDEYKYEIVVDTKSEQLNSAAIVEGQIRISVGVFIVIKIVGDVEIKIEDIGYAAEPPECEEFEESQEEDVCKAFLDFTQTPFPQDFFPVDNIE
ncbi:hypothetical protein [Clostridium oryzae]|uniref:Uncharacterized protein n=1 Tax=Clostridium oryzae TaxID=1450648 RepID=A0A1V4IC50_9CLOT|nr:hypothetical protein [Clostridium oryzae]OPJ57509.1 hypothetical protein CLORY_40790 [Clostridium oryzae]